MRIAALGLPVRVSRARRQGYLRGVADLKTPLVIVIVANAVNLVLEVLFVYGFGWGIEARRGGQ
jgi:Na+-driven multidrug efflux pump